MSLSKASDKRSSVLDTFKTSYSCSCSASTVKGFVRFIADRDIDDPDKWGLEWKFLLNGSIVFVYLLDDLIATKGPITPKIRLFCLQYASNPDLLHYLRKWKYSRSTSSPHHSYLSLESIYLDDL
jgi:hypothetical protein